MGCHKAGHDLQEAAPDFPMMGKHKVSCDAVELHGGNLQPSK
jgi:hypothetical protein